MIKTLSKFLEKIEVFILTYGIIAIAIISIINVIARNVVGRSISSAEELCQFLIIWITFFGTAYGARQGRHIRMSAIYDQLKKTNKKRVMIFICTITAMIMFLLTYYSCFYLMRVQTIGIRTPALDVPLYLVYLAAPLGLFITGIQYLLTLIRNLTAEDVYVSFEHKEFLHENQEGTV